MKRKFYLQPITFLMVLFFALPTFADEWTEDFESHPSTSYGDPSVEISGRVWTKNQAGNFSYGNTSVGSYCFTINDDKSGAHITTPVLNTCGTVSFKYAFINGTSTNVFVLQKSTNGTDWIDLETRTLGAEADQSFVNYSFEVNDASSTVYIRILSDNQDAHLFIDDFTVTNFAASSVDAPASFDAVVNSPSQIDLNWTKNADGNDVVVAWSNTASFGDLVDGSLYNVGTAIDGGGTVIYNGGDATTFNHTGLDAATAYFYQAWSVDGSLMYSNKVAGSAITLKNEPTNHVTDFDINNTATSTSIELTWTGSTGTNLPEAYLLIGKKDNATFQTVTDGTPIADDTDWTDGLIAVNLPHVDGDNAYTVLDVLPLTDYTFRIYPYANSDADIDYKTDAIPEVLISTPDGPVVIENQDFNVDMGNWTTYNAIGDQVWIFDEDGGSDGSQCMHMSGYDYGTYSDKENEDWLISPAFDFDVYDNETLSFDSYTKYAGLALIPLISTDYDGTSNPNSFTWVELNATMPSENSEEWTNSGVIDLSNHNSSYVYIAFKYLSTDADAARWLVDNVEISGTLIQSDVNNPQNFATTVISASQIDLEWTKNEAANDVLIAYNVVGTFGTPENGTTYSENDAITGGGTVLYVGDATEFNHTGLDASTAYYYKIWSVDPSNSYSIGLSTSATTLKGVPTNHVTDFAVITFSHNSLELEWTAATGEVLPDKYLLIGKTMTATFPAITNGQPLVDDTDWNDNLYIININHQDGAMSYDFSGLTPEATYDFVIYPYSNSDVQILYKTDGTVPSVSQTLASAPQVPDLIISEVADPSDAASARFVELYNTSDAIIDFETLDIYLATHFNSSEISQSVKLTGQVAVGETYIIANSSSSFESAYGFVPNMEWSSVNSNGDDGFYLFFGGDHSSGELFDAFGEPGVDGSGTDHEFTDGRAVRKPEVATPNPIWTANEWVVIMDVAASSMTPGVHPEDMTPPEFVSMEVVNGSLVAEFSENVVFTDGSGFEIKIDDVVQTIDISGSGTSFISFTIGRPDNKIYSLQYDATSGNVEDENGNALESFGPETVMITNINIATQIDCTIYPNPVKEILYINTDRQIQSVVITAINGQVVKKEIFTSKMIDISSLKSGVYNVSVKFDKNTILNKRIIKL